MHLFFLIGTLITASQVYAQQSGFAELGVCNSQVTDPITYSYDKNAGRGDGNDPDGQTYQYQLNTACGNDGTPVSVDLNACLGNNNGTLVVRIPPHISRTMMTDFGYI